MEELAPGTVDDLDQAVLLSVLARVRNGDFGVRMPLDWTGVAGKIADGFNEVIAANQRLGAELARVSRVVGKEGRLSQRVVLRGSDQVWFESIESVNSLIEDLVRPTSEMQRVVGAVADGDLSKKITGEVHGEMLELKNTVNVMVDQLNGFVSEVTRVARDVGTAGKLGQAAAVTIELGGVWKDLTDNVNLMAGNLTRQVRDIAEVTTAVANGDLSKKISADVKGEFLELKNTVNAMVDQLNRFASEVTRVAREVGVEGKLGGQAQSAEIAGVWKDLTDNVNQLAANLTNQVRAISDVATAVTEGDLTRQVGVKASGEVAVLKDKLNEMIRNLRETTRQNTEQDWLKTNLERFTRMLQGQRDMATVSNMILSELAPLVSAQHGVFYTLVTPDGGGEPVLRYLAGYGYKEHKHLAKQFGLGEGLVGQCAQEKERILLTDVPGDYVTINSGLGESPPLNIIVLPILFEGLVRAVVELASFSRFSHTHQAFLDQLTESIGLVLNTIEANTLTENLLKQSQSQAQELQSRQEDLRSSNEALRDSEASTQAVLDNVADGIVTASEDGVIESLNRSARALFGYGDEEMVGQPLAFMIAPGHRAAFRNSAKVRRGLLIEGGTPAKPTETLGCRQDNSTFPMEVEYGEMKLADRSLALAFVRDISDRKAHLESLEHQALHDGLTGLANRTLFGEHLLQALASAKRTNESRAVLVMDLDGFKEVNDTLGHDQGDNLLKQVGNRLVAALRETDTIARLGGDEFAILPGEATDLAAAATIAWKIQQTCATEFKLNDEHIHAPASVGIALCPEHGTTPDRLLRRADAAMYVAKRSGSGHAVFDIAREQQAAHRLALLVDLRQCTDRDELVLHYQPKINLGTREITGVEALVRWRHPVQGLLPPASFMAEVERTQLITPVTRWVLNEALRQQRIWRDGGVHLTMAVNISAHSLRPRSNLPDTVAELTETWGTAPERLTLELTEGGLIEAAAPEILERLHDMGEMLSIDDFGTGYSSLAYLQRLPVDELKIDRSFVTSLSAGSDDAIIVSSTVDLAHNLGLNVVAEGVEEGVAMDLLQEYGCDSAQGYLFSRPCPAQELTAWLTESPYGASVGAGQ